MRARALGGCLGICAAIASLGMPAAVAAKPGFEVQPKSLELSLKPPDSNGYSISIVTAGHKQVYLLASKGKVHATYSTTGHVTRRGIDASFGALGHVSVRFQGTPSRGRSGASARDRSSSPMQETAGPASARAAAVSF